MLQSLFVWSMRILRSFPFFSTKKCEFLVLRLSELTRSWRSYWIIAAKRLLTRAFKDSIQERARTASGTRERSSALVPKIHIFKSKKKGKILKCASWLRFSTKNECRYRKTNEERHPPWERGGREKESRPTDRNRQKDRACSISHIHTQPSVVAFTNEREHSVPSFTDRGEAGVEFRIFSISNALASSDAVLPLWRPNGISYRWRADKITCSFWHWSLD